MEKLFLKVIILVIITRVALSPISLISGNESPLVRVPTKLPTKSGERVPDALDFVDKKHDLRLIFSSLEELKARLNKSVCVIDRRGLNKPAIEMAVDSKTTIRQIMSEAGVKNEWKGSPQIKVLKRNSLVQSPLRDGLVPDYEDLTPFLATPVSAGDIVFITMVE